MESRPACTKQPEFLVQAGVYKLIKKDFRGTQQALETALRQIHGHSRARGVRADLP